MCNVHHALMAAFHLRNRWPTTEPDQFFPAVLQQTRAKSDIYKSYKIAVFPALISYWLQQQISYFPETSATYACFCSKMDF